MNGTIPQRQRKRRQLSCLPCRLHKLKCDRRVPCETCVRYIRTKQCNQHPAPEARIRATRASYARLEQGRNDTRSGLEESYDDSGEDLSSSSIAVRSSQPAAVSSSALAPLGLASAIEPFLDNLPGTHLWDADSNGHIPSVS